MHRIAPHETARHLVIKALLNGSSGEIAADHGLHLDNHVQWNVLEISLLILRQMILITSLVTQHALRHVAVHVFLSFVRAAVPHVLFQINA